MQAPAQLHGIAEQAGIHVCEDALDALMPLFLRVDRNGDIVNAGRTMKKLFDGTDLVGQPMAACLRLTKPRYLVGTEQLSKLIGKSLVFETTSRDAIELQAMVIATSGSSDWLFNFSLGSHLTDVVERFGLRSKDFAPIDSSIDLMQVASMQADLLSTSQDLTTKLETSRIDAERRARTDDLTGLPNRAGFQKEIEARLQAVSPSNKMALFCLDLDNFKTINDTLGHDVGDLVLKEATKRLLQSIRKTDFAARLGGDEFAIILAGDSLQSDCETLAARIVETMRRPFMVDGQNVLIGASVGISLAPTNATTVDQLFKTADIALYRAKADGRGAFRFFTAGMEEELQHRRSMEVSLREALERDQFTLHFQPLINTRDRSIAGYEALLRWVHPEKGMIPPMDFIPLAEETGLIDAIGQWVLVTACREAASWPSEVNVAINFSALQLASDRIIDDVAEALSTSGLAASRLEIEVTESVLLQDAERALAILNGLKSLGVNVSMDDFGTGYSSLSYLQKYPFDKVKLDKSFVDDLDDTEESVAIVRAVVELTHSLGKMTTAEGVETRHQAKLLRQEGCDEIQGYLISKPIAASEIPEFERRHGLHVMRRAGQRRTVAA